jgi:hypothetical protein
MNWKIKFRTDIHDLWILPAVNVWRLGGTSGRWAIGIYFLCFSIQRLPE